MSALIAPPFMPKSSTARWLIPFVIALPLAVASSSTVDAVLLNQSLAVALCGALLLAWNFGSVSPVARAWAPDHGMKPGAWGLVVAIGILVVCSIASRWRGDVWPLELGVIAAAVAVCAAACAEAIVAHRHASMVIGEAAPPTGFAWGWWAAGLLCVVIAALQYFAAEWTRALADAGLLAASSTPGRAVGNMRQPNHLATALVCAMVWTAWLWQARRLPAWMAGASIVAMVFAVALSASRTGALSLAVLLLWAVADRRLPRKARWLLALTPLIYLACWFGLAEWAALAQGHYYGAERLQSAGDPSSSRVAIWKNSLALIGMHPWTGVGWGQFNFAWTFTPFPDRPRAFFDHTHNLPLQLAVEIGLPATVAVLGLLGWALWRARGAWSGAHLDEAARRESPSRAAFVMLVVLGVHSMLEYPLWYAYFLLPAAWALGLFIGGGPASPGPAGAAVRSRSGLSWALAACGVAMIFGSAYALWDHRRIERIFEATPGAPPLAERIADGRRSRLFGHHADYAAVTNEPRDTALASFRRPLLQLVDVRLMTAYIEALKAAGEDRKALYAAQRLREFRRDDAQAYFKACDGPEPPFQCEREPVSGLTWRDVLPP